MLRLRDVYMKMSSTCGKESPHSDRTFTICSSFVAKCGKDNIIVCKYKLFEYDYDETWSDILSDLLDGENCMMHKTGTVKACLPNKLTGTVTFTSDMI